MPAAPNHYMICFARQHTDTQHPYRHRYVDVNEKQEKHSSKENKDRGKYLPCFCVCKGHYYWSQQEISSFSISGQVHLSNASLRLNWTPRSSCAAVDFLIPEITHMRPRSMWSACQALWTTSKSLLNHVRVSVATRVEAASRYCFRTSQMSF